MSNTRKLMVLNPGSGKFQRYAWAGGKAKVRLHRYLMAQRAAQRARRQQ